jgi:HEAT repeat protein
MFQWARSVMILILLIRFVSPSLAQNQTLVGRFYPEKQTYLVGEPVFIDFEIANIGEQPVWIDGRMGQPCIEPEPIVVVGAKYIGFGSDTTFGCFGGVAGSCAGNEIELKAGENHIARIFLSALYRLDHAGVYQVQARRRVPVNSSGQSSVRPITQSNDIRNFSSYFQITLAKGSEDELRQAFQPYVGDIDNSDSLIQSQAIWAITEMAPPFLEDVILELADVPNRAAGAAVALGRLNTTKAKKKLAELAEDSQLRQSAIRALAGTRDRAYLPVLIHISRDTTGGDRAFAIMGAGLIGGDDSIPFLVSVLQETDANVRVAALRGLGISGSRSAVPVLIDTLQDTDEQIFREATQSLAELTHHSITSEPWAEKPSATTYNRWLAWWSRNKLTAPVYDTNNCVQPKALDPVE